MADLLVDFVVLDAMQRSLVKVAGQFEGLGGQAQAPIWGGSHVRAAMEEFAENWKVHRGKLTEDVRKLGERCAATVEVFRGVDAGWVARWRVRRRDESPVRLGAVGALRSVARGSGRDPGTGGDLEEGRREITGQVSNLRRIGADDTQRAHSIDQLQTEGAGSRQNGWSR